MLWITNGNKTISVTKGAYECFYKYSGFKPVEESQTGESSPVVREVTDSDSYQEDPVLVSPEDSYEESEEDEEVDYSERPISDLSFWELEQYADQLGVDHKGIRSKKELRAVIKEYLGL